MNAATMNVKYSLRNLPHQFGQQIRTLWFEDDAGVDLTTTFNLQQFGKYYFSKNDALDRKISAKFGPFLEGAIEEIERLSQGAKEASLHVCDKEQLCVASLMRDDLSAEDQYGLILLLDQFTRNIYRNNPKFIVGDPLALQYAKNMVAKGLDKSFPPLKRLFIYLPFEHSENLQVQQESLALFKEFITEVPADYFGLYKFAQSHFDEIQKFGRFPSRNAILGRTSTSEELAFLREREQQQS